jgi:hypothetical protein
LQFQGAVFPRNEGTVGRRVFEGAGKGGDDLATGIGDDGDAVFFMAIFIKADDGIGLQDALLIERAADGGWLDGSGIPDELEYARQGNMKFADRRMTADLVIMPFDDVCQCCRCEVIGFAQIFFLIGYGDFIEQFFVHFIDPCLCIGKEENEFDPLFFVKAHSKVFRVDAFLFYRCVMMILFFHHEWLQFRRR